VERCSTRAELGLVDPHGVKGLSIHDVEAAASIHQYLDEPRVANDGINNKRVSAWVWNAIRVVIVVKGDGRPGPVEERWRGWLSGVDLSVL
jgi:hypothetical protein